MRWTARLGSRRSQASAPPAVAIESSLPPALSGGTSASTVAALSRVPLRPDSEPAAPFDLPGGAPGGCRVAVVGPRGTLVGLPYRLPSSWETEFLDEPGDLTVADLVVLTNPTPGKIAAVQARQPDASVVVLAHPTARVDTVVELLQAGATACVRSADPGL